MDTCFSPEIDKYFAAWILPDTWNKTDHPSDCKRFHMFVKALDHYEFENRHDESLLREKIVAAVLRNHNNVSREGAQDIIEPLVLLASNLLEFLSDTREFPDPNVDAWEPPLR